MCLALRAVRHRLQLTGIVYSEPSLQTMSPILTRNWYACLFIDGKFFKPYALSMQLWVRDRGRLYHKWEQCLIIYCFYLRPYRTSDGLQRILSAENRSKPNLLLPIFSTFRFQRNAVHASGSRRAWALSSRDSLLENLWALVRLMVANMILLWYL